MSVISGRLPCVTGRIERDGAVIHLIAERTKDMSAMLPMLARPEAEGKGTFSSRDLHRNRQDPDGTT